MTDFKELQQRVFELVGDGGSSVASHLNLYQEYASQKLTPPEYFRKARVAFLSNFTFQSLPEVFQTRAIFHNLWMETYLAPYNQYAQEILNSGSRLHLFNPTVVYLAVDLADADVNQVKELADRLAVTTEARVVIFNRELADAYKENKKVFVFDFENFLNGIGKSEHWYTKYKELGDLRLAPDAFPKLADAIVGYTVAASGATKKCLALDLDNTLWSGIVGEDGPDKITPDQSLQARALELYKTGVILAINSRNNPEDALSVINNHSKMILRQNHFAAQRINWQDKAQNLKELAEELMLGLDSFVFVDDDPYNLSVVKAQFPEVATLTPPMLAGYTGFQSLYLTEEDKRRGQMYAEEFTRRQLKSQLGSVEDFLKQLNLRVKISPADENSLARVAQLTQKTNQFNLATRRYSEDELKNFLVKGWKILTVSAIDRFGDYGVIGVQMIEPSKDSWRIDNFLLSCRILGRGIEKSFLAYALEQAKAVGARKLLADFIPTKKNKMAESFYPDNNFQLVKERDLHYYYEYDLTKGYQYPKFIEVIKI